MLKEVIGFLNLKQGDIALDATVGGGGHSKEILKKILPDGKLIALDVDESALKIAEETLKDFRGSFNLINDNFRNLDSILADEKAININAVLFDIGLSSYQLEDGQRGFSIKEDARLDMRMNRRLNLTAYDIVNRYKEDDLSQIIWQFGEERFNKRIANYIVTARSRKPIETTHELADIIRSCVGSRYRKSRIDPATRTFQAIRIVVNDELSALEEGLKKAVSLVVTGGRICVISFHSLEDRIVKNLFKEFSKSGLIKIVTKKPVRPSQEEVVLNPRSRSARLRVAERI